MLMPLAACGDSGDGAPPAESAGTSTPANAYEQQRNEGVQRLLDALSAAVLSGDRRDLDVLIDPLATDAFRAGLHRLQDRLGAAARPAPSSARPSSATPSATAPSTATTPSAAGTSATASRPARSSAGSRTAPARTRGVPLVLNHFGYRIRSSDDAEPRINGTLDVALSEAGSSDSWIAPVALRYALGGAGRPGVDEPVIALPETFALARYDDDWKLLGDGSLAADAGVQDGQSAQPAEVGPWTYPGLLAAAVRTDGGQSAVLSYPGTEAAVARVEDALPKAVTVVSDFWGRDWPRRAVIEVTAGDDQFAGLTRTRSGQTSAAAAATVYSRIDREDKQVIGQRVVLSPNALGLTDAGVGVVLRHELTHVATRLQTADDAPMWLTEGVAEYLGRRGTYREFTEVAPDLATAVAGGSVPQALPDDEQFSVSTDQARLAYQSAWSFAAYLAGAFGENKLKQLYLAIAPAPGDDAADRAFTDVLGRDRAAVVRQWGDWLRKQVK